MTSSEQRKALQNQIWKIANDVRGAVDGWDFKQYVLGTLFYRFISENFTTTLKLMMKVSIMPRWLITPEIKDDAIKTKGYFIYPHQLFANITETADTNESLNADLGKIFT